MGLKGLHQIQSILGKAARGFMKDRQNTINGWVLFAGIVALGGSIVSGEVFKAERPEKMGYPIEGVVAAEGGEAAKPIEFYLASADVAKGEQVFKKCTACHNADNGGANALGPNLWGVLGEPIGKGAHGFAFSEALAVPSVVQRLHQMGLEPLGGSPTEYKAKLVAERTRWTPLIRETGMTID